MPPKTKIKVNINGQNIKLPLAEPHLPPDLVRSFENDTTHPAYRSIIFIPEFNIARHVIATGETNPEMIISSYIAKCMRQAIGTLPGTPYLVDKSTWLHLAATTGDIPLFYEILRIGCHLEVTDEHGRTPLYAGCERLTSLMPNGNLRSFPGTDSARLRLDAKRIEKVCILLVEQHAALDTTINGKTPLHMACATNSWDLIKVLLQHGADPAPVSLPRSQHCISLLRTSAEKERFKALAQVPHERPPRPCPCWSGKTLKTCHAREVGLKFPYPPHFICRCKSRKTYAKCCHKKGVLWEEVWDPVDLWIRPDRVVQFNSSMTAEGKQNLLLHLEMAEELKQSIANGTFGMSVEDLMAGAKQETAEMVDMLVQSNHVDPGYAYAAKREDFMPVLWTGLIPKIEQKTRMEEWNSAVDEYIDLGTDTRMREVIENECKIGLSGGPLYPRCENDKCNEPPLGRTRYGSGHPPTKLLICIGCKKAMYCSKECQREAWGLHKPVCKSGKAQEQLLSSQQSIAKMHDIMLNSPF